MDKQLKLWTDGAAAEPRPCDNAMPSSDLTARDEAPRLITSGVISQETGQPLHRVLWVLKTRPDIRPAAYAGIIRLFTRSAIARVRHELNAIDAKRSTQGGNER